MHEAMRLQEPVVLSILTLEVITKQRSTAEIYNGYLDVKIKDGEISR
jgi:hypothetical protein